MSRICDAGKLLSRLSTNLFQALIATVEVDNETMINCDSFSGRFCKPNMPCIVRGFWHRRLLEWQTHLLTPMSGVS